MLGNEVGGGKKSFQFIMENGFQIDHGYLVVALLADILWGIGLHIHALPTMTIAKAGEKLHRLFAWRFFVFGLVRKDLVALTPEGLAHDRFNFQDPPFAFRFILPFPITHLS